MTHDHDFDHLHEDDETLEAYCVRCREKVPLEDPVAVWTRRGLPATRGECPYCGGAVFRMGKSSAHERMERPSAVKVASASARVKLPQETIYIAYSPPDEAFAEQLAADLQRLGMACWLHDPQPSETHWAGGVHPALSECARMVVLLSDATQHDETVAASWAFFRSKRKPLIAAQIAAVEPPDDLRRAPRFDFRGDYKTAFRQLIQALHN